LTGSRRKAQVDAVFNRCESNLLVAKVPFVTISSLGLEPVRIKSCSEWGVSNPSVLPWRSSAALAYLALHREPEARKLVAEELTLARQFGAPRAIGIALVVDGLAHQRDEGTELIENAVRTLEPSGAELELARALVELGAAHRRHDRRTDAREHLRAGQEIAYRCGANALAERARR
jgi:hypothetical protein